MIVRAVLRIVGSATALVPLYYALPLNHSPAWAAVTMLVIGSWCSPGPVAFQVRAILRSPFPGLRAIEVLATSIPLLLLLFASFDVVMAMMSASNFGGRLTNTDGLYFAVTVFSTVGFGDITAKTQAARLVVTGQMIADLIILGLAVEIILGAVSRRRQTGDADGTRPADDLSTTTPQAPNTPGSTHGQVMSDPRRRDPLGETGVAHPGAGVPPAGGI